MVCAPVNNERISDQRSAGVSASRAARPDGDQRQGIDTMLRAKSLPEFLEMANTDGMMATMLLQVRQNRRFH